MILIWFRNRYNYCFFPRLKYIASCPNTVINFKKDRKKEDALMIGSGYHQALEMNHVSLKGHRLIL